MALIPPIGSSTPSLSLPVNKKCWDPKVAREVIIGIVAAVAIAISVGAILGAAGVFRFNAIPFIGSALIGSTGNLILICSVVTSTAVGVACIFSIYHVRKKDEMQKTIAQLSNDVEFRSNTVAYVSESGDEIFWPMQRVIQILSKKEPGKETLSHSIKDGESSSYPIPPVTPIKRSSLPVKTTKGRTDESLFSPATVDSVCSSSFLTPRTKNRLKELAKEAQRSCLSKKKR